MAKDYAPLLATVRRLIEDKGRQVTFQQYSGEPADVAKPWRGPVDADLVPADTEKLFGVFVSPDQAADFLGLRGTARDFIKRTTHAAIVEPGTKDLRKFHQYLDGTETRFVSRVDELKPGDTILLYFIFASR